MEFELGNKKYYFFQGRRSGKSFAKEIEKFITLLNNEKFDYDGYFKLSDKEKEEVSIKLCGKRGALKFRVLMEMIQ